eukprot:768342-Hanusia_phi.AAC.3
MRIELIRHVGLYSPTVRPGRRSVAHLCMSSSVDSSVLDNALGEIILNRPQALNAADSSMTQHVSSVLRQWREDSLVKACVLRSSSDRAFCSGGDVKAIALSLQENRESSLPSEALGNEYKLIVELSNMNFPTIAIMNGVTMGFGIGLGCSCRYRVVTEKTVMAMPENGRGGGEERRGLAALTGARYRALP